MREIGGYFGLETFTGKLYHEELIALNNGRNALLYLLRARKIKKLYIPWFLCNSVSNLCDHYGYAYEFYRIDQDFMPIFEKALDEREYLYVVNFYGQLSNEIARQLKKQYGNIIFDNIHAFFQKPVRGIDTIYSCRKFFGVPDGAFLATDAILNEELAKDISKDRMKHVLGRFEGNASDYYTDFKANDHSFVHLELRNMSSLTENLLRAIDYESVCCKRNENYARLACLLGDRNEMRFQTPDGPYAYPFYCSNGVEVRNKLAKKRIFVATLWPNVLEKGSELEKKYARNILPLPCDQRYGSEEMDYIAENIGQLLDD